MRDAAQFVRDFQTYWRAPTLEGLDGMLTADVVLRQPLAPSMRGLAHAKAGFARIFALLPDLHAEVDRWSAAGDAVFIEFRLIGTLGGRRVEWPAVDRFTLREGMATERVSYFDPTPLIAALVGRPRAWPRFIRSGYWRAWIGGGGATRSPAPMRKEGA